MTAVLWPITPTTRSFQQWVCWAYPNDPRSGIIARSRLSLDIYDVWAPEHRPAVENTPFWHIVCAALAPQQWRIWLNIQTFIDRRWKIESIVEDDRTTANVCLWVREQIECDYRNAVTVPWRGMQSGTIVYHEDMGIPHRWTVKVNSRQRAIIAQRDRYQCQLCSKETNELHIDHIRPINYGGFAVPWNLWALCARCNLQKTDLFYEVTP